jgi:hypothetical protein
MRKGRSAQLLLNRRRGLYLLSDFTWRNYLMKFISGTLELMIPAAVVLASPSFAAPIVPAGPVTIQRIVTNGSGCPIGSVAQNISTDKRSFTLSFSEFVAETGPELRPSSARKNCVVTATLRVPAGWQYTIGSFYYRGFMGLDQGIRATHRTSYFFEGQGTTGNFEAVKDGPLNSDFVYTDRVGLTSVFIPDTWSRCNANRALNINTSIRLTNINSGFYPNARGLITNDTIDGELTQVFGLTWRRCS